MYFLVLLDVGRSLLFMGSVCVTVYLCVPPYVCECDLCLHVCMCVTQALVKVNWALD